MSCSRIVITFCLESHCLHHVKQRDLLQISKLLEMETWIMSGAQTPETALVIHCDTQDEPSAGKKWVYSGWLVLIMSLSRQVSQIRSVF